MTTTKLNLETATYEELCDFARDQSRTLGRYCAIADVTHYMQSRTRTTILTSTTPLKSFARGPEFVGVGAQWYKGQPFGTGRAVEPTSKPVDRKSVV